MRIVSLLPSATEIVYALGLEDSLVAVTAECDHPPAARHKPVVSFSALAGPEGVPGTLSAQEIDQMVGERVDRGEPLYTLDVERIRDLRPDLVLAQDLCRVCAVPSGMVAEALELVGGQASVISLDPATLDEVLEGLATVGQAAGVGERASATVEQMRARVEAVRRATASLPRPRVLALEWSDPPFVGGHWVPDMVAAAGGEDVLGRADDPSRQVSWEDLAGAAAEVVVFMPCGYTIDRAVEEGRELVTRPELAGVARAYAVDATSYFSRPGPRLVDGVELLAAALHPGSVPGPPEGRLIRLR